MGVEELTGKTLTVAAMAEDSTDVTFVTDSGDTFKMYHSQDCCESVYVESIVGDLSDLIGSPILLAEEVVNDPEPKARDAVYDDSHTWTFYKLATIKGGVTIRWLGQSNGYYSESVDFAKFG